MTCLYDFDFLYYCANEIVKKSGNESSMEKKKLILMTVEDIKKLREDYIQVITIISKLTNIANFNLFMYKQ